MRKWRFSYLLVGVKWYGCIAGQCGMTDVFKCTFVGNLEKFCAELHMHKDTCMKAFIRVFTLAVLLIVPNWKYPKSLS